MKRTILAIVALNMLASCSGGWNSKDNKAFTKSCMEDEATRRTSRLTAQAYCECVLKKTAARYPTIAAAKENKDSAALATDLEICRRSTR